MFLLILLISMVLGPIVSIELDPARQAAASIIPIAGKWFVFWIVGIRLVTAGLSQVFTPKRTAAILGIDPSQSGTVVRELGFSNLAVGVLGLATLWWSEWRGAAALVGGLFFFFAGIQHIARNLRKDVERTKWEKLALISDVYAALILLGYFGWLMNSGLR